MTETFYLKVDVTSNEDPEFIDEEDEGITFTLPPGRRAKFNSQIEKAVTKVLKSDPDYLAMLIEDSEGMQHDMIEAMDEVTAKYYDPETDITSITENFCTEIKFSIAKK